MRGFGLKWEWGEWANRSAASFPISSGETPELQPMKLGLPARAGMAIETAQTAEAASAVDVQVLSRAAFDRLRHDYREFDDALLRLMTRHMRLLSGFFADAHLTTLSARIASRIVANSRSFGVPGEAGTGFSVRLSQSDFALMVGASRQSVNKVLQRFQEDGLIVIEYGALVVRDLDRLQLRAAAP